MSPSNLGNIQLTGREITDDEPLHTMTFGDNGNSCTIWLDKNQQPVCVDLPQTWSLHIVQENLHG